MQKVYLLLRSNQQSGPYSLEELVRFDLKPGDLIWIEGRSAGWYYPQEIEALRPYLAFVKKAPEPVVPAEPSLVSERPAEPKPVKKVFVAMPAGKEESRPAATPSFAAPTFATEEAVAPKTTAPLQPETPELKTAYAKSLDEVETDYMNWVYQKKKPKKSPVSKKGVLAACLLAGVAFAAWWGVQAYSSQKEENTAVEPAAYVPVQNEIAPDSATEAPVSKQKRPTSVAKKQKAAHTGEPVAHQAGNQPLRAPVQTGVTTHTRAPQDNGYEGSPESATTEPAAEEKTVTVATEAPKEKKKLRDKIADLFRKKPDAKAEEPKPAGEEDGNRQSTRRETGSSLVQLVSVKFTTPNDWMMGIKGAKATLANRSSETVTRAVVEVLYYNDDNDLLEKKTVTFTNVKSKQTQTVAVPDHQTATRLEYNVVSATGAEPVARL